MSKLLDGPPRLEKARLAEAIAPILVQTLEKRKAAGTVNTHSLGRLLLFVEREHSRVIHDRTALRVLD